MGNEEFDKAIKSNDNNEKFNEENEEFNNIELKPKKGELKLQFKKVQKDKEIK